MIGDWDSLLILDEYKIPNVIPMNPLSLIKFVQYSHGSSEDTIDDMFGKPMQLKGGWNAPSNFHQFKSAVQLLHKLNRQEGPYKHVCIYCMKIFRSNGQYPAEL